MVSSHRYPELSTPVIKKDDPTLPWVRASADFENLPDGCHMLVVTDDFSKYLIKVEPNRAPHVDGQVDVCAAAAPRAAAPAPVRSGRRGQAGPAAGPCAACGVRRGRCGLDAGRASAAP
ncbi:hypothetical protein NDU88_002813 [Pleurodeles waltl]|uniref:Uncharacterized protein n=1 Tax=Pleurodeles waltl TaxID=8319 RepID=A0AAV7T4R5_PLEWA|nr:hypothetical protein NDU88_002813 [Pleurodeles waltl]